MSSEFSDIERTLAPLYEDETNKARIRTIEEHLGFPITPPNGFKTKKFCLIGEGNLKKICRKELKERYFVLFSHCLVYCNSPPVDKVSIKKPLLKTNVLPTCGMEVQACSNIQVGERIYEHCLKVQTQDKSFIVVTESSDEQRAWEEYIQCAIAHSNHNHKFKPNKKVSGSAPVWIPDQNFAFCPVCNKTKFTAINRRHHCRKCGTLMCGECQKFVDDKVKKRKEKVCSKCYSISRGKSDLVPSSQLVPMPTLVTEEEKKELAAAAAAKKAEDNVTVPSSALVQYPKYHDMSSDSSGSSDE